MTLFNLPDPDELEETSDPKSTTVPEDDYDDEFDDADSLDADETAATDDELADDDLDDE
jgi:hypothetical protein